MPILGPLSQFWEQKKFSRSVTHNFIWDFSTMPRFRKKLIIQFQENACIEGQTEGQKDGKTEGRTDPIL